MVRLGNVVLVATLVPKDLLDSPARQVSVAHRELMDHLALRDQMDNLDPLENRYARV